MGAEVSLAFADVLARLTPLELFVMLAGPAVGSWLATLAVAWPRWPSLIAPSVCDHCGTPIPAWRMIPIVTYMLQRGRCAVCGGSISTLHPIVEFACLTTVTVTVLIADPPASLLAGLAAWLLIYAAAVDARSFELPDWSTAGVAILGAGLAVTDGVWALAAHIGAGGLGLAALYGLRAVFSVRLGREALGLGDVKLAGAGGLFVGPLGLAPALAIAGLITLALSAIRTRRGREIPFGPGLAAGLILVWISMHAGPISFSA